MSSLQKGDQILGKFDPELGPISMDPFPGHVDPGILFFFEKLGRGIMEGVYEFECINIYYGLYRGHTFT